MKLAWQTNTEMLTRTLVRALGQAKPDGETNPARQSGANWRLAQARGKTRGRLHENGRTDK